LDETGFTTVQKKVIETGFNRMFTLGTRQENYKLCYQIFKKEGGEALCFFGSGSALRGRENVPVAGELALNAIGAGSAVRPGRLR
jgi:hypothetical protein